MKGENDDESKYIFLPRFNESEKKKEVDNDKKVLLKIDGGYGDYILRYHHIKQRIQNKLIPEKVAMPELSEIEGSEKIENK